MSFYLFTVLSHKVASHVLLRNYPLTLNCSTLQCLSFVDCIKARNG